jgi:hypothetical protein
MKWMDVFHRQERHPELRSLKFTRLGGFEILTIPVSGESPLIDI